MRSNMDLIGMYNYDASILDDLQVPEEMDAETIKTNLLLDTAEMELLYTDFKFMKFAIGAWSKKQLPVWQELYDTTQYEYNPIWNKDGTFLETQTRDLAGTEDWTDTHNLDLKDTFNKEDKTTYNIEDKTTYNSEDKETRNLAGTNDTTQTNSVYGFNSSSAATKDSSVIDQDTSDTGTDTFNKTGTDTINKTGTDTLNQTGTIDRADTGTLKRDRDITDTGTITIEREEHGNIGVTSTQSMIKEQREVVQLNMTDVIINDFINRFCLKVY